MSAIVSANEAAHHFGLSEKTVRRWIKAARLKADKSGRAYRVALSEVGALIGPDTAHDSGHRTDSGHRFGPSHNGLKVRDVRYPRTGGAGGPSDRREPPSRGDERHV